MDAAIRKFIKSHSMIIYFLILTIFLYLIWKDYHKAVIIYLPLRMLFHLGVCLKSSPPAITLDFVILFSILIMALYRNKQKGFKKFPLYKSYIFTFITYAIAIIISPYSLPQTVPSVFTSFLSLFGLYLLWNELKNVQDCNLLIKSLVWVFAISLCYGTYEYITQSNPIVKWEVSLIPEEDNIGKIYSVIEGRTRELRFNSIRCQSFTPISISWGGYCAFFLGFLIIMQNSFFKNKQKLFYLLVLGSIANIFFAGSRSPIIAFLIIAFSFIFFRQKKLSSKSLISAMLLIGGGWFIFGEMITGYINSIFSNNSEIKGSSITMRAIQLETVLYIIKNNPVFGIGTKGFTYITQSFPIYIREKLLGAESLWFHLLIERGILGILSYIAILYQTYRLLTSAPFSQPVKKQILFFFIAWIALVTMTSTPGLGIEFFLMLCLCYYKYNWYTQNYLKKNY